MEANSEKNVDNSDVGEERAVGEEAMEEEDVEIVKSRILGHPLFGLLIETHVNCLKVGLGETEEVVAIGNNAAKPANSKPKTSSSRSSDLDLFMEAYCITLSKLKEAMEEQMRESSSFIQTIYDQIRELGDENHPEDISGADCA